MTPEVRDELIYLAGCGVEHRREKLDAIDAKLRRALEFGVELYSPLVRLLTISRWHNRSRLRAARQALAAVEAL